MAPPIYIEGRFGLVESSYEDEDPKNVSKCQHLLSYASFDKIIFKVGLNGLK